MSRVVLPVPVRSWRPIATYPKAAFVHVEVWRDFEKQEVNKAAADWLLRRGDLHEPWVFVIGPNGKITARFDNVASKAEIEGALKRLPTI